jgi:hypothetical protein
MGVPSLEVGYTSAATGRGDHEVLKGHVVALGKKSGMNPGAMHKAGISVTTQKEKLKIKEFLKDNLSNIC